MVLAATGAARGRLDLVVLDAAGRLRFVVRARTGAGFGTPAESVTGQKLHRFRQRSAWLAANPSGSRQVCFDVVGVDLSNPDRPRLELFEDVM